MSQEKQHYLVFSPWIGRTIGCCWDDPGKDGYAVVDDRDVILKSSPALTCIYCGKTMEEIIQDGREQGKSAYDALHEAGFIKNSDELLDELCIEKQPKRK